MIFTAVGSGVCGRSRATKTRYLAAIIATTSRLPIHAVASHAGPSAPPGSRGGPLFVV
jgi:hypothetical protein